LDHRSPHCQSVEARLKIKMRSTPDPDSDSLSDPQSETKKGTLIKKKSEKKDAGLT